MKKNKTDLTKDIIEQFQLPSYVAKKTFAEASKAIDNKFKDRKDQHATQTKEELLERLAEAQEYVKMQQEAEAMANMPPEMQQQMMAQQQGQMGQPQSPEQMMSQQGGGMPDLSQILGQGRQMAYGGFDEFGREVPQTVKGNLVNYNVTPMSNRPTADTSGLQTMEGGNSEGGGMSSGAMGMLGAASNGIGRTLIKNPDETIIAGDPKANQGIDATKDTVAQATGPIGQAFRGVQKLGQGVGDQIGGEGGAFIADGFSPEESTFSMFSTNKDAKWDEKIALTMPGTGGIVNKRLQDRKKNKEDMKEAVIYNNQFDNDFAMGGYLKGGNEKNKEKGKKNLQQDIAETTGINFDKAYVNEYFGYADNSQPKPVVNNVDLGQYKNRNFFNIKDQGSNVVITPTSNNPQNAQGYKEQMNYIMKLNPNVKLDGQYQQMDNRMMYGGYGVGETYPQPEGQPQYQWGNYFTPTNPMVNMKSEDISINDMKKINKSQRRGIDWDRIKNTSANVASFAPIVGSLTNKISKPNTQRGHRLDNRYQRELVDERGLLNSINQNNIQGALTEASGGDSGRLSNNLLGAHLNKQLAQSNAYATAAQLNAAENRAAQSHNLNIDRTNAQLEEAYIDRAARDEGAYNTAKSANRNAIFNNIGALGRETVDKNIVKKMFGYKWDGTYWVDPKDPNNKVSDAEYKRITSQLRGDDKKDKK